VARVDPGGSKTTRKVEKLEDERPTYGDGREDSEEKVKSCNT
jgi:hypothetical protein